MQKQQRENSSKKLNWICIVFLDISKQNFSHWIKKIKKNFCQKNCFWKKIFWEKKIYTKIFKKKKIPFKFSKKKNNFLQSSSNSEAESVPLVWPNPASPVCHSTSPWCLLHIAAVRTTTNANATHTNNNNNKTEWHWSAANNSWQAAIAARHLRPSLDQPEWARRVFHDVESQLEMKWKCVWAINVNEQKNIFFWLQWIFWFKIEILCSFSMNVERNRNYQICKFAGLVCQSDERTDHHHHQHHHFTHLLHIYVHIWLAIFDDRFHSIQFPGNNSVIAH